MGNLTIGDIVFILLITVVGIIIEVSVEGLGRDDDKHKKN